jgi:hypothetical protein
VKKFVLVAMAVLGMTMAFGGQAEAKMTMKKAMKACKAEMAGASKADIKACAKDKLKH